MIMSDSWIFPWNPKQYYLHEYFEKYDIVDWKQGNYKIHPGDNVYIYGSKPEQRICYLLHVVEVDIPYEQTINDEEFWGTKNETSKRYCRLKLVASIDTEHLSLDNLLKNGLLVRPQGKQRITGELLNFIESYMGDSGEWSDPAELGTDNTVYEGAKKTVTVNQYERNQIARQKCIKINGCRCAVCGIDFESMYGEIGRGFIHVHHVVPISSIGESYKVDPAKDLVPVCPNCHAMLHRGKGGKVLTVEELRAKIIK